MLFVLLTEADYIYFYIAVMRTLDLVENFTK